MSDDSAVTTRQNPSEVGMGDLYIDILREIKPRWNHWSMARYSGLTIRYSYKPVRIITVNVRGIVTQSIALVSSLLICRNRDFEITRRPDLAGISKEVYLPRKLSQRITSHLHLGVHLAGASSGPVNLPVVVKSRFLVS